MEKNFGLYCQVCYYKKDSNSGYYTTGSLDDMSLRELNAHGEKQGWKKGIWK